MTITIEQITEWRVLHNLFNDAKMMYGTRQREFLDNEVYPRLREYVQKYATKYDHLNKPK